MQKLSSGSNESSIFAIFEDIVFVFFTKKHMKIKLSPALELNFCGPVPLNNQFYALALSLAIL